MGGYENNILISWLGQDISTGIKDELLRNFPGQRGTREFFRPRIAVEHWGVSRRGKYCKCCHHILILHTMYALDSLVDAHRYVQVAPLVVYTM